MPTTRRQTAHFTRSNGPASIPNGPGRSKGVKGRQKKAKSKTSGNPEPSALRSDPDNKEIPRRILWSLVENYFLWLKIILEPFRRYNETVVLIIIVATLLGYPFWIFRSTIINAVTDFWQERITNTTDLPSVYFNDAYPLSRCPDEDMEYLSLLKNPAGISPIFLEGNASGLAKSNTAYQVGVCLFESLKQSKQDNRPVDVITINVSSETFCVTRSIYRAIEALCGSERTDCIKQINEELIRHLFRSDSNSLGRKKTLKFLFIKLYKLMTRRKSHGVIFLFGWEDSDTMNLLRLLVPITATTNLSTNWE